MGNAKNFSGFHVHLWAKTNPYKPLLCHMIDAGCCAGAYLNTPALASVRSFLSEQWDIPQDQAIQFVSYLTALHDIGKATPQFQMQSEEQLARLRKTDVASILPDVQLPHVRHEFLSRSIANRIWKGRGESRKLYDAYSCVLSLHHQRQDRSDRRKPPVHEGWHLIQDEIEEIVREVFHAPDKLPKPKQMDATGMLLTGILVLCDWVASSGPFDMLPEIFGGDYFSESCGVAEKTMREYGLVENHPVGEMDSFQSMWPGIKKLRDIQKKAESIDPSALLTIIEAPMGEGKTEAALYCAERSAFIAGKRGVYVALPTQATSNQMYGRINDMLESVNGGYARLMHGTAFLMKDEHRSFQSVDACEAEKWLGSSRMGMLDENGVGTVDQAMGAVLLARFGMLRLLGLSNKALIIDELHAYDAYMSEIIESLLRWCRALKIPVVLLSATLQNSQRIRYLSCYADKSCLPELSESYPLITQVKKDGSVVQIDAKASMITDYHFSAVPFGQDDKEIARFASEKVSCGGCYCIIVNTVKRAQGIYRELVQLNDPDVECLLFHARFPLGRREEIEKECLFKFGRGIEAQRPGKAILVATQVVEQSLDIDFDGMISEVAPIDLLLQRAGRVHRHRERVRPKGLEEPVIHVILPDSGMTDNPEKRYGSSGFVYDPFLLFNTERLLEEGKTVRVPADVRSVIAEVYEHVTEGNMKAWIKHSYNEQLLSANADWIAFPPPEPDYFFPTQSHPEFENLNIDDGFDSSVRAATRLGDPTFRIAFVSSGLKEKACDGKLTKEQQKEILLSSVSLRLTPEIEFGLSDGKLVQIRKGVLWGCYLADCNRITIGSKCLVNDPVTGVYWEE